MPVATDCGPDDPLREDQQPAVSIRGHVPRIPQRSDDCDDTYSHGQTVSAKPPGDTPLDEEEKPARDNAYPHQCQELRLPGHHEVPPLSALTDGNNAQTGLAHNCRTD
jgi:hypothetical protein